MRMSVIESKSVRMVGRSDRNGPVAMASFCSTVDPTFTIIFQWAGTVMVPKDPSSFLTATNPASLSDCFISETTPEAEDNTAACTAAEGSAVVARIMSCAWSSNPRSRRFKLSRSSFSCSNNVKATARCASASCADCICGCTTNKKSAMPPIKSAMPAVNLISIP